MKKVYLYIAILCTVFLVSCEADDDVIIPIFNQSPEAPKLVFPSNNLTCASTDLEFAWNTATDPDGDTVSYVIEIAAEPSFNTILFTSVTSAANKVFDLEKGITYYWRVKASDDKGNDGDYSTVQSFFTEPEASINRLPGIPELISPGSGNRVTGSSITLDWDANDADGDSLTYDVYFGISDSPSLLEENSTTSQIEVSVSTGITYYWRVVVKDSNQNATMGQIWNFRTE
ncbi:fibronectin type III domain-containing protein [Aquimarina mytili]|uniref:Fibronectin type III domain-containing protein n=1 Tax=Aquimarina mytili TaxID=874423 RepID=A0A936ZZB6_9FLAO|nr:fibronectin type III domain-containing protein [Aquimarina mytili]MBL0683926.1 fibronectin type III domain-containing protein [Aquimarina mytili]